jgi:hypothetical protein
MNVYKLDGYRLIIMVFSVRGFGLRSSHVLLICGHLPEELDVERRLLASTLLQQPKISRKFRTFNMSIALLSINRIFGNNAEPIINSFSISVIHIG